MKSYRPFLNFLVKFEGLKLTAYKCPAGVWTIGIGSTFYKDGTPVKSGDKINVEEAYELAEVVAKQFYNKIKDSIHVEQSDQQWIALLSLAYNIGVTAFTKSSVVNRINQKKSIADIEAAFMMWTKAGGKELQGLVTRRKAECSLYAGRTIQS